MGPFMTDGGTAGTPPINPRLLLLHQLLGGGQKPPSQALHGFGPGGAVTYSPSLRNAILPEGTPQISALLQAIQGMQPPKGGQMENIDQGLANAANFASDGANPGGPMIPYTGPSISSSEPFPNIGMPNQHQNTMGNTNRPADLGHATGDPNAANMWMQHHPGASSRGQIPPWVTQALFANGMNPHQSQVAGAHGMAAALAQHLMRQRGAQKRSLRRGPTNTYSAS